MKLTGKARSAFQEHVLGRVDKVMSSEEFNQSFFNNLLHSLDRTGVWLMERMFSGSCSEPVFVEWTNNEGFLL